MTRVQIPAYTDHWMMGDRYGEVVDVRHAKPKRVANAVRTALVSSVRMDQATNIAHVKLDKSGKIVRVILDDCEVV